MSVDLPPQHVEQCVIAFEQAPTVKGAVFLVVAGKPSDVDVLLDRTSNQKNWTVVSRGSGKGVSVVVLRGSLQMTYRDSGGLIYQAQSMGLAISMASYPPMCEPGVQVTQAQADAMTKKCGAPKKSLTATDGELRFEPAPDLDYKVAACVLGEIKKSGVTKFGFIGNEQAQEPKGQ